MRQVSQLPWAPPFRKRGPLFSDMSGVWGLKSLISKKVKGHHPSLKKDKLLQPFNIAILKKNKKKGHLPYLEKDRLFQIFDMAISEKKIIIVDLGI